MIFSPKEIRRFRRNRFAIIGSWSIAILVLVAIFGYTISPDSSQDANSQQLAIKLQKPGLKLLFLELGSHTNTWSDYFTGQGIPSEFIAIEDSFYFQKDTLIFKRYKSPIWSQLSFSELLKDTSSPQKPKDILAHIFPKKFLLGTDALGRDVLSRLILGTRISLLVGFIAVIISLIIGTLLGALAGYYGGWIDKTILWIISVFWAIPTVLLAMVLLMGISSDSKHQYLIIFLAVGLTLWVDTARMVRGQFMQLKEMSYIEATRAFGFSDFRIIFSHILPNTLTTLIVITASNFATAILMESGLSYLGLGVQPPTPSWGSMMKEYYAYLGTDLSYLAIFPGLCIMIAVLSFYALGNGLRDAFDIKGH